MGAVSLSTSLLYQLIMPDVSRACYAGSCCYMFFAADLGFCGAKVVATHSNKRPSEATSCVALPFG